MKTKEEIKDYIRSQEWYPSYLEYIACNNENKQIALREGLFGVRTIQNAFNWNGTKEGYEFWRNADRKFRVWLYGRDWCAIGIFAAFCLLAAASVVACFFEPSHIFTALVATVCAFQSGSSAFKSHK